MFAESITSMRLIRGSTVPPNCVPFIRPTTNCVCRYGVMLFLLRPQKLQSAKSVDVQGYASRASSALPANDESTSRITRAGS